MIDGSDRMKQLIVNSEDDRVFFHIVTLIICMSILASVTIALFIDYFIKAHEQDELAASISEAEQYNEIYFSGKILNGVTISGYDVGGMSVEEAKNYLAGCVDYNIAIQQLVLKYGENTWVLGRDRFPLTVDVDNAVSRAVAVGRKGTDEERTEAFAKLDRGEKIDISATKISDPTELVKVLCEIKEQTDIEKKNAGVTFRYENAPVYSYTDEVIGSELDVNKAYNEICALLVDDTPMLEYTLKPDIVVPAIKRSDLEHEYSLVGKFTTWLSASSAAGRIQNITTALLSLDERVWLPGETFSFNQWVGARSEEKGYGLGVFINEQQQYDQTVGGGICQVSTTIYNCALACGANMQGRNAPIEITERRPHTWPSEYIDKGLDATVSWPSTDLKMFNNSKTPYFIHTYITRSGGRIYVNVEFYGTPLPNNASVKIETEVIEEIPATEETIIDSSNKYGLAAGQQKTENGRNGYTVNVYQVWSEPGKENVKSLITVSKYEMIPTKIYVSPLPAEIPQETVA